MSSELTLQQSEALFSLFSGDCTAFSKALADLKAKNKPAADKCCYLLLRVGMLLRLCRISLAHA